MGCRLGGAEILVLGEMVDLWPDLDDWCLSGRNGFMNKQTYDTPTYRKYKSINKTKQKKSFLFPCLFFLEVLIHPSVFRFP